MIVRPVQPGDWDEWLRMRMALWPDCPTEQHRREMSLVLEACARGQGEGQAAFVAERAAGRLGGFIEAGLRPYAEGCDTSPVGYIEGWYVDPDLRRRGVGRALVRAAETWARAQGCQEMASDCRLDNEPSRQAHLSLGYEEAERLIHFRKGLYPEERK